MEEPEEDVTFIDQKALNRLERIPSNRWKTKKSTFAIRAIAFHFFRQKDIRTCLHNLNKI